jgi:hypothetical protein
MGRRVAVLALVLGSLLGVALPARAQTAFVYLYRPWQYDVSGVAPASNWRDTGFDDSAWQSGEAPIGYGAAISSATDVPPTVKTVYLRSTFTVGDPSDLSQLTLEAGYAQGLVAYLNGQEVLRQAMPAGTIDYDTAATGHLSTALEVFDVTIGASALVTGKNVLAVEVHQTDPPSPDFYWAARLFYDTKSTRVTRGPYLQLVTPTSAVVRWRTNQPTDSRVHYGSSALDQLVSDAQPTARHELTLNGLSPASEYGYDVGSASAVLAGGDAEHRLKTAPETGTAAPVRVWVLGDSGS